MVHHLIVESFTKPVNNSVCFQLQQNSRTCVVVLMDTKKGMWPLTDFTMAEKLSRLTKTGSCISCSWFRLVTHKSYNNNNTPLTALCPGLPG